MDKEIITKPFRFQEKGSGGINIIYFSLGFEGGEEKNPEDVVQYFASNIADFLREHYKRISRNYLMDTLNTSFVVSDDGGLTPNQILEIEEEYWLPPGTF